MTADPVAGPMSARLVTVAGLGAVARRHATDASGQARLRAAAAVLDRLADPGLVEVAQLVEHDGATELLTRWVPGPVLAQAPLRTAGELAGVLAAVAATVQRLHHDGVAHGQVSAEHILLGASHPVLCGIGGLAPADAAAISADVAALGRLTVTATQRLTGTRGWATRRRLVQVGRLAADRPAETDAQALAAAFAALPGARLPARSGDAPTAPITPSRRHRVGAGRARRLVGAVGIVVAIASIGAGWARLQPSRARLAPAAAGVGRPVASPSPADHVSASGRPTTSARRASTSTTPASTTCPSTGASVADPDARKIDLDGDGCPEVVIVRGPNLVIAGVRYSLGRPGDDIVFGAWFDTGVVTPALLRPGTGAVFFFRSWPGPGHDVQVGARAVVRGAIGLRVRHRPGSPDQLIVERSGGPPQPISP